MTQSNENFKKGMEFQKSKSIEEKDQLLGVIIAEFISDQLVGNFECGDSFNVDEFWVGIKPHVISALTDQCRWGTALMITESDGGNN